MTNKSLVYMLVAVMVGYMLVSAVPNQIVMYTTPQQSLSLGGESSEVEPPSAPEGDNVSVERYWDSTNSSDDDQEIWFKVDNSTHGGPWNDSIAIDELGFSMNTSEGVYDINEQVADLAVDVMNLTEDFEQTKSDIADVAAVAEDAVAAAEAATEAGGPVASTANSASQAAADAAEAATAAREAASGLTTPIMAAWWILDILIAIAVYWFAKQRFS